MMNIQYLGHHQSSSSSKYAAKYTAKVDAGNRVKAYANAHSGDVMLAQTHLFNTKIGTSAHNEKLAEKSKRDKGHDT